MATTKRKGTRYPSECHICGAPALYAYYGVLACRPCKTFFKRNAESKQKSLKCDLDGHCQIDIDNRHTCSACRLKKCFQCGMTIEMIRGSIQKKSKELVPVKQFPILNLLNKDLSSLDNNQWRLLSNLMNNYDEVKLFSMIKNIRNEDILTIANQSLINDLLHSFYQTAEMFLHNNFDIAHVSSNDRSILLQTAANNVACLGATTILHHSQLIYNPIVRNYFVSLYGPILVNLHCQAMHFIQSDIVIFKLALALFAFSTNSRTNRNLSSEYENMIAILNIENKYAELTWKYLLYKYGYQQAVQRFMKIIELFLEITLFVYYAQQNPAHINDIDSIIQQTELTLLLDETE